MIENWEIVTMITAEYTEYSDFDLQEILDEENKENETKYKLEDIKDYYIKRNKIHLTMYTDSDNEWVEIQYEWVISEWDYKRPDSVYFNNQF